MTDKKMVTERDGPTLDWLDMLRQSVDEFNRMREEFPDVPLRLSGADLSGADLSGADLKVADLSGADLSRADLSGAYLFGAILRGAKLSGAKLSGAKLQGVILRKANLTGADLRRADLTGADLRDADLFAADLEDARLEGAFLPRFIRRSAKNVPAGYGEGETVVGPMTVESISRGANQFIALDTLKVSSNIAQQVEGQISTLREAIESLSVDEESKEKLRDQLQEYETATADATQVELDKAKKELEQELFELDKSKKQLELEFEYEQQKAHIEWVREKAQIESDRQQRRRDTWLDKEMWAVVTGVIILIFLVFLLGIMGARGKADLEILENVLFVVLGFFFGQQIATREKENPPTK